MKTPLFCAKFSLNPNFAMQNVGLNKYLVNTKS